MFTWLTQFNQRRVNIVAIALFGNHECNREECLAANQQRGAGRAQGKLLDASNMHVEDL